MKLIKELSNSNIWYDEDFTIKLKVRKASRALLKRELDWKYALLYVWKGNYHKLPWWWIEMWEDINLALYREIEEEVWCSSVIDNEIGLVIEYRQDFEQIQLSYCYRCSTSDKSFSPEFTEKELANWFELRRYDETELLDVIRNDQPENYEWKFIQIRAESIITEALKK